MRFALEKTHLLGSGWGIRRREKRPSQNRQLLDTEWSIFEASRRRRRRRYFSAR